VDPSSSCPITRSLLNLKCNATARKPKWNFSERLRCTDAARLHIVFHLTSTDNMDPLGAAGSLASLIEISGRVFNLCRTYYLEVKSAREDIRRLRDEMTSLQDVLANVKDIADGPGSAKLSIASLLNQSDGLIQKCLTELQGVARTLDAGSRNGNMRQFGLRAIRWPFSRREVDKTVSIIGRQKEIFNLALTADAT
jgi:ankyrin repeat domain-containing protein 50